MDTKEKLIELIKQADDKCAKTKQCENCCAFGKGSGDLDCVNYNIADHLIANGVNLADDRPRFFIKRDQKGQEELEQIIGSGPVILSVGEDSIIPIHTGRWIPVSERKPENDYGKHWKERKHYLVRLQKGTMVVARYGYKDYGWWIDSHDCVLDKERYREVTHWMPLPEPPKEDE